MVHYSGQINDIGMSIRVEVLCKSLKLCIKFSCKYIVLDKTVLEKEV